MTYQMWIERDSGARVVVRLEAGEVIGAASSLSLDDYDRLLTGEWHEDERVPYDILQEIIGDRTRYQVEFVSEEGARCGRCGQPAHYLPCDGGEA